MLVAFSRILLQKEPRPWIGLPLNTKRSTSIAKLARTPTPSSNRAGMRVKVLGSAAGGGFPQWNCACPNCSGLRSGAIKARPRTQAQVVVTPNQSAWFLLNASPDLRQQILATPELSVTSVSLASPISTILLTSADVDCVMGLLHLREFQPLHIYSTLS